MLPPARNASSSASGNSHFTLIRLSVKQSGGRRLAKDAIRRVQKAQKFVDLRHRQVGNRVEVVRAVAPFREIADVGLATVAGTGDKPVFGRGDGIKR